ncbi:MAG: hypothetical protein HOH33_03115 [Verrucomicrobia bacterium]|nr:hypothetical protein [Verrucomicrobiota bacterium]
MNTLRTCLLAGLLSLNLSCGQDSNQIQTSAQPRTVTLPEPENKTTPINEISLTSFDDWIAKCNDLPPNRKLNGRFPSNDQLPLKDLVEFKWLLDKFLENQLTGPLSVEANWLGKKPSKETFFNTSKVYFEQGGIPFEPFAQKLNLKAESKILFHGDLHGDLHSLNEWLKHLNREGLLKGFKATNPNLNLLFLGDYTDRGAYGVEVMYVLMRLRVENPSQVWMARGNHEDIQLTMNYGFLKEATSKYGPAFPIKRLSRIYDFLPVVIYAGHGNDYIQCNHGGVEPGYRPADLLDHPTSVAFHLLGQINQKTFIDTHTDVSPILGQNGNRIAQENFKDFTPTSPTTPTILGFMWNDFTLTGDEENLTIFPGRAWVYGKDLTNKVLKESSSQENKIRAIFRAHQHFGIPNPMMRRLVHSHGVFRHWQESRNPSPSENENSMDALNLETENKRRLVEGSAYTFNVAPDSNYGAGNHYDFDTFGILNFAEIFEDWELEVVNLTNIRW